MNTLKTTFLMALLTVLLVMAGGAMGGEGGMILAVLVALVMNGISYWFSDKIVLRMYGAKEISAEEAGRLLLTKVSAENSSWISISFFARLPACALLTSAWAFFRSGERESISLP